MANLLAAIFLTGWGVWCVVAAILRKKVQVLIFPNDEYLPKKVLGRYYDGAMNLFFGIICIASGIVIAVSSN